MEKPKSGKSSEIREDHAQKAHQGLRRMLYGKELVPGQKISCRDIAEQLGMSLTPVIQALKYMEFQGFVRHAPNRGYFMTPFDLAEVEEIYELRELLEPSLVAHAARRLDTGGRERLKSALEAHLSAGREAYLQERIFKNLEFHLTLASLSGRQTQIRILENLFDLLILKYGGNQGNVESMDLSDNEHQRVYDCLTAGDVRGARQTLSRHVAHVKKQVLARFKRIQEEREAAPL
ncbi:MAG: GntR family transcriptional regulator [Deltaproteobacteria bacterium]|nr:GntR family transcriptional regulator [Deltaproteobacteria bacterium]